MQGELKGGYLCVSKITMSKRASSVPCSATGTIELCNFRGWVPWILYRANQPTSTRADHSGYQCWQQPQDVAGMPQHCSALVTQPALSRACLVWRWLAYSSTPQAAGHWPCSFPSLLCNFSASLSTPPLGPPSADLTGEALQPKIALLWRRKHGGGMKRSSSVGDRAHIALHGLALAPGDGDGSLPSRDLEGL
jgi:hypothetical protein